VKGRHCDANVNDYCRLLIQLCCNNAVHIMNTFVQQTGVSKCTLCKDSLGKRSLSSFCIVSVDLFRSVLAVRVKMAAELPTDHRLVVLQLASGNAATVYTNVDDQEILKHEVGGPG